MVVAVEEVKEQILTLSLGRGEPHRKYKQKKFCISIQQFFDPFCSLHLRTAWFTANFRKHFRPTVQESQIHPRFLSKKIFYGQFFRALNVSNELTAI